MIWTALVLAGARPGGDPFAAGFGTDLKALIPVAGEPMVRRPVRALLGTPDIGEVVVLSQAPERVAPVLPADPRLSVRPSAVTIAETLIAICDDPRTRWPVLVTTADHALLTPAMIADFCAKARGADIAIAGVEQRALLTRLPGSRRTWLKFRGGAYSGANLFALRSPAVRPAIAMWRAIEQDRKKGLKMLWAMGPATFVGGALRLLSVDQVLARVGRGLGLRIRPVIMTDPLAAVDVDKAADHELVEALLAGQA